MMAVIRATVPATAGGPTRVAGQTVSRAAQLPRLLGRFRHAVWLLSVPGSGVLSVPAIRSWAARRVGLSAFMRTPPAGREVVLIVEDDRSIRETTEIGLRAAGFAVLTAASGDEGLRRYRESWPSAVVLDLMLPGIDGLEVCRQIRAGSATPVIILTARTETADVVMGLEAGADDYLRKPFAMAELVARVRAAIRRAGPGDEPAPATITLGPLTIDPPAHAVYRDGLEVELSHTEFQLLLELARRPGQVFTREALLDHVWGYDYLGDSRLVDVAIGRLRAKVEADPTHPELILTVRGAGYKAVR